MGRSRQEPPRTAIFDCEVAPLDLEDTVGFCPRRFAIVAHDPLTEAPLRDRCGRMRRIAPGETGLLLSGTDAWAGYADAASRKPI